MNWIEWYAWVLFQNVQTMFIFSYPPSIQSIANDWKVCHQQIPQMNGMISKLNSFECLMLMLLQNLPTNSILLIRFISFAFVYFVEVKSLCAIVITMWFQISFCSFPHIAWMSSCISNFWLSLFFSFFLYKFHISNTQELRSKSRTFDMMAFDASFFSIYLALCLHVLRIYMRTNISKAIKSLTKYFLVCC